MLPMSTSDHLAAEVYKICGEESNWTKHCGVQMVLARILNLFGQCLQDERRLFDDNQNVFENGW